MYETLVYGSIIQLAVILLIIVVLIAAFTHVRRTKAYRREVGDLYVASKIRQIAKSDDLDLDLEKLNFLEWNKKTKLRDTLGYNYDDSVEEELQDKVEESMKNLKSSKGGKK